jgi:hypothetical protein
MNHVFEKFVSRTTEALEKDGSFLGLAIVGSWIDSRASAWAANIFIVPASRQSFPSSEYLFLVK